MRSNFPPNQKRIIRPPAEPSSHSIDPLQERFLAIIERRDGDAACLAPLYYWREPKWERVNAPSLVNWPSAPASVRGGSLWIIHLELEADEAESTQNEKSQEEGAEGRAPRLLVRTSDGFGPEAAAEALIERNKKPVSPGRSLIPAPTFAHEEQFLAGAFPDLEDIRRTYYDEGKELSFTPQECVYIAVQKLFALGPVSLIQDSGTGRWRVDCDDPSNVRIYQNLTDTTYHGVDVQGVTRFILRHRHPSLRQVATGDFRRDSEFISALLQNLTTAAADVTSLQSALAAVASDSVNRTLYQRRRAEDALTAVAATQELRAEIGNRLLALPAATALVEAELYSLRLEATRRIEEEMREAAQAATNLRAETAALEGRKATLEQETAALTAEIARLRIETTEEVDQRIARIAAAVAERVNAPAPTPVTVPAPHPMISAALRSPVRIRADAEAAEEHEAIKRLKRRLKSVGVDSSAAAPFLAAIIAGIPPVVIGPAARRFLAEVGNYIFGGYALRRTITPLTTECADLFGKVHAPTGTFRPDAERLADLLLTADSETLNLVVFEGFNRCEVESVFGPLLLNTFGNLPILHPCAVHGDDPYCGLGRAAWPHNFVACFQYAADGVRPPLRFWAQSATIVAAFSERDERGKEVKPVFLTCTYVAELLQMAEARRATAAHLIDQHGLRETLEWTRRFGIDAALYLAALLSLGVDEAQAGEIMAQSLTAIPMSLAGEHTAGTIPVDPSRYLEALDAS